MKTSRIPILTAMLLFIVFFCSCAKTESDVGEENTSTLGMCMSSSENSYTILLADSLRESAVSRGAKVYQSYCENSIGVQLSQAENYLAMGCDYLIVECVGKPSEYQHLLDCAHEQGTRVLTISSAGKTSGSDVCFYSDSLEKGICAGKIIQQVLPEEQTEPIVALILCQTSRFDTVQNIAGYQLLTEKYLRYYDTQSLSFQRWEDDCDIFYYDNFGKLREVEEETGGLYLNEDGEAVLNPYYIENLEIYLSFSKDIETLTDGQKEIDDFLVTEKGSELQLVLGMSSDAAIGAADRLMYYAENSYLTHDISEIAVIGSNDTDVNRNLVLSSWDNESLLRGFVGSYSIRLESDSMVRLLFSTIEESYSKGYGYYSVLKNESLLGITTMIQNEIPEDVLLGNSG